MPVNGKNVTWQWAAGVLLTLVFAAVGIIVADTRTGVSNAVVKIEILQDKKLDKEQYYRDIGEIKQTLKDIVIKIDKLKR